MQKRYLWPAILLIAAILYWAGRYVYLRPAYAKGDEGPDIQGILHNGNNFNLDELSGKYVLVDFWGSWCGPCLKELPALQQLYASYHDARFSSATGFEIVSIAVEQDPNRWHALLERFRPAWPYHLLDHTSSLRFFDGRLSKECGVKTLPTKFLLDPAGAVLATNLSVDETDRFLSGQLRD